MKVYVINLDRHPERLAHMRDQLRDVGFERVEAIDGIKNPETTTGLTRFELACLESHRNAWLLFLKRADEFACFLEDDVHLQPNFGEMISTDDWIPDDAHSLKLDTYLQEVTLGERSAVSGGRRIARLYSRHESSAAYILSRAGAERYLELTVRPNLPADYALFPRSPSRFGLHVYQLEPAIAVQDHLLQHEGPESAFPTAMSSGSTARRPATLLGKIRREASRVIGRAVEIPGAIYLRATEKVDITTVGFG